MRMISHVLIPVIKILVNKELQKKIGTSYRRTCCRRSQSKETFFSCGLVSSWIIDLMLAKKSKSKRYRSIFLALLLQILVRIISKAITICHQGAMFKELAERIQRENWCLFAWAILSSLQFSPSYNREWAL